MQLLLLYKLLKRVQSFVGAILCVINYSYWVLSCCSIFYIWWSYKAIVNFKIKPIVFSYLGLVLARRNAPCSLFMVGESVVESNWGSKCWLLTFSTVSASLQNLPFGPIKGWDKIQAKCIAFDKNSFSWFWMYNTFHYTFVYYVTLLFAGCFGFKLLCVSWVD